jgi:glycosyltransferase involved in cell wall biosynthesis
LSTTPRLALVVPSLEDGGGVASVARFLLATAQDAGWEIELISLATSSRDDVSSRLLAPTSWRGGMRMRPGLWEGVPFTHIGCRAAEVETRRYAPRPALSRLVEGCDVVQVVAGSPAWGLAVQGLETPMSMHVATRVQEERRRRSQLAHGPLGLWRRRMTGATTRLEEHALLAADAIQVMNPWMLDVALSLNEHRAGVDIRLAPPGVDASAFRPNFARRDSRYVLSVGRFDDPRKNITLLLEAFAVIADRVPDVALVTAGATAPPAEFDAAVVAAGLAGRVRHVARPSHADLVKLYQGAEVFALSSDEEGLGVVLLEAMACGVPVVSTRSGGPDGVISEGRDGYLVDRHSADQLGARLLDLLTQRELRDRMGTEARRTIEGRFAMAVAGRQFVDVWNRLLEGGR